MLKILCLDEDVVGLDRLEEALKALGHQPLPATTVAEGLAALEQEPVDLVVTRADRLSITAPLLIERLRNAGCDMPVLLVSPESGPEASFVPGNGNGVNVVRGPLDPERLRAAVDRAFAAGGLSRGRAAASRDGLPEMIGDSEPVRRVLRTVAAIAPSTATVLIQGESGTGKELIVNAIHRQSHRADRPLVAVNCAALPEGLIESTLFGHEKGSFTGALGRHVGAFERANGGTLLLDEISELRLDLQAKLLRVIQEHQVERVGGSHPVPVDVRLVATTNRSLAAEVRAGRFRSDLFYRLNVISLRVPALRQRPGDIDVLAHHFVRRTARALGIEAPLLPEETVEALREYAWPGNVRELQHAAERAVLLNRTGPLRAADFYMDLDDAEGMTFADDAPEAVTGPGARGGATGIPPAGRGAAESRTPRVRDVVPEELDGSCFNLRNLEQRTIMKALEVTNGHRVRAARLLGISDRTLRNKLKEEPLKGLFGRPSFPVGAAEFSAPARLSVVHLPPLADPEREDIPEAPLNRLRGNAVG